MLKSDLAYNYPEHLVATERKPLSRVMLVEGAGEPTEVTLSHLITEMSPDDLLVINETRVVPARVFSTCGLEVLFIKALSTKRWQVLSPIRRWPKSGQLELPQGVRLSLVQRGLPQEVEVSHPLGEIYFDQFGEPPLPPYINQVRGEAKSRPEDRSSYQSAWARISGSLAAPTASLHFNSDHLEKIKNRGVSIAKLCLHVGLGTFLPVHSENLRDHKMHSEWVHVPEATWLAVQECRQQGGRVWCLGSTVTRALESIAHGELTLSEEGYVGETSLFIQPGFEFRATDVLMTNFHQPESTLLAMVMAFAGKDEVLKAYDWAIERQFRLFSYGDLSVWKKS